MRISDWSSDVCSSDLKLEANHDPDLAVNAMHEILRWQTPLAHMRRTAMEDTELFGHQIRKRDKLALWYASANRDESVFPDGDRSEEHTSELQSLMRSSYTVLCLKKNKHRTSLHLSCTT